MHCKRNNLERWWLYGTSQNSWLNIKDKLLHFSNSCLFFFLLQPQFSLSFVSTRPLSWAETFLWGSNIRKSSFWRNVLLYTAGCRSCCHLAHFFLTIAHSSKVYSILSEVDGFSFHCSALFTIQNPIHALGNFFSLHVSTSANVHTFSSDVILYQHVILIWPFFPWEWWCGVGGG